MFAPLRLFVPLMAAGSALAGPFPPAAGLPGSDAVPAASPRFMSWATDAVVTRGPVDIDFPDGAQANYGQESWATGPANATPNQPYPVVSLGDGGTAELTFAQPFGDVPGPDFAVFENGFTANGFTSSFLELAHVEVSSDGVTFFRFPSSSLTPTSVNLGEGGAVNPTNVHNLAGKYVAGFGTPFDLAELGRLYPALDIQRITHVRVVDVVGTNVPSQGSMDSENRIIVDPYPTPFPSCGFDLDAVGAFQTTTTSYGAWTASQGYANAAATPVADPDHDAVPNLIEYLTGDQPLKITVGAMGAILHFPRLAYRGGADLNVEGSTDLIHWITLATSVNAAEMTAALPNCVVSESGGFRKEVELQIPSALPYRYFRLAGGMSQ